MLLINWALIGLGLLVFVDGIGSVLIEGGQFHNVWFDGERYIRAVIGILIVALGAL